MSETSHHNPEAQLSPIEQGWANLYDATHIAAEELSDIRAGFETIVENAKATVGDSKYDDIVEAGADLYRWMLFTERGDRLPDSLAVFETGAGFDGGPSLTIGINPNHAAARGGRTQAIDVFSKLAGEDLSKLIYDYAEVGSNAHDRAGEEPYPIFRSEEALVRSTGVYGFLHSFNEVAELPGEQPLTQSELHVRVAAGEYEIKHRYGMSENDDFVRGTAAGNEYTRLRLRLEDETTIDGRMQTPTPEQRARQFFVDRARAILRAAGHDVHPTTYKNGIPTINYTRTDYKNDFEVADEFRNWASFSTNNVVKDLAKQYGQHSEATDRVEILLLQKIAEQLDGKIPWNQALATAVDYAAREIHDVIGLTDIINNLHIGNPKARQLHSAVTSPYWVQLLKPKSEVFDGNMLIEEKDLPIAALMPSKDIEPTIDSKEDIERRLNTPFARISRRGAALSDTHSRVVSVFETADFPDLPLFATDADLQMELVDPSGKTPYMSIPGYTMVAFDATAGRYQYRRDIGAHDPYDRLPESGLPIVSFAHRFLHDRDLTAAADRLDEAGATVQEIIDAVRDTSDYALRQPKDASKYDGVYFGHFLDYDIDVPIIDGRAQVQCTGANIILHHTLVGTFGAASTTYVSGRVLEAGDGIMSESRHRQVSITHEGKRYILDATPPSSEVTVPGQRTAVRQRALSKFLRRGRRSLTLPSIDVDLPVKVEPDTKKIEPDYASLEEYKQTARPLRTSEVVNSELESEVQRLLQIPGGRKQFFERLVEFKEADPVRRTLAAFAQGADHERLIELRQYISNYQAKPQVARQHGLQVYGPVLMDTLGRAIDEMIASQRVDNLPQKVYNNG